MIVNHEDQKGRLWWCTNLFWASVAVLAGGRLLLLHPGEPVDLLEPLGHPEHLWEATSHVGYLRHLLAARVSRLLRNRECKRSFYAAWQGIDKDSTHFHFFSMWDFHFVKSQINHESEKTKIRICLLNYTGHILKWRVGTKSTTSHFHFQKHILQKKYNFVFVLMIELL